MGLLFQREIHNLPQTSISLCEMCPSSDTLQTRHPESPFPAPPACPKWLQGVYYLGVSERYMVLHNQSTAEEKVIYRVNPQICTDVLMPAFQIPF